MGVFHGHVSLPIFTTNIHKSSKCCSVTRHHPPSFLRISDLTPTKNGHGASWCFSSDPGAKLVARPLGSHTFCWRLIPYASLTPPAESNSSHIFAESRHVPVTRTSKKTRKNMEKHGKNYTRLTELWCLRLCPLVSHLTPKNGWGRG